jgi:hypothetical protein
MQTTWKPTAAGVLEIIAGALSILVALGISLFMPVAAPFRYALMSVGVVTVLFLGTGVVAIIGGIFALQRRHWGTSLAGAICALMPPATLLGIVAVVFISLAREEFGAASSTVPVAELEAPPAMQQPPGEGCGCTPEFSEPSEAERNA